MSEHNVTVAWQRHDRPFGTDYTRDHSWTFSGGTVVGASSSPELHGNPDLVDPEAAFVASISSCHMMWFLFLAAKHKLTVDSYTDAAVGYLERDTSKVVWVTRVELAPVIEWAPGIEVAPDKVRALHDEAHERCFIANSVKSEITIRVT